MRPTFCACVCRWIRASQAKRFPYTAATGGRSPAPSSPECRVSFRWPARTSLPVPEAAQLHPGERHAWDEVVRLRELEGLSTSSRRKTRLGRPTILPAAWAALMPDNVRSRIIELLEFGDRRQDVKQKRSGRIRLVGVETLRRSTKRTPKLVSAANC